MASGTRQAVLSVLAAMALLAVGCTLLTDFSASPDAAVTPPAPLGPGGPSSGTPMGAPPPAADAAPIMLDAGPMPGCGDDGQPCCYGTTCRQIDLTCGVVNHICRRCGHEGQLCCGGASCADGFLCEPTVTQPVCDACGDVNQPCCPTGKACRKARLLCTLGMCQSGP